MVSWKVKPWATRACEDNGCSTNNNDDAIFLSPLARLLYKTDTQQAENIHQNYEIFSIIEAIHICRGPRVGCDRGTRASWPGSC